MSVGLDHSIVWCHDQRRSAAFLAEILGRPAPVRFGPFLVVDLDNGASLDYHDTDDEIVSQHFAFLVSEPDFDDIFGRMLERGMPHWADPGKTEADAINHNDGGRGVYFDDPDGHLFEIITRRYGSGA